MPYNRITPLAFLAAFTGVVVACAQAPRGGSSTPPVAFTHISVIDARTGAPLADRTVVVRGRHIVNEGPSPATKVPADARVIDGRGKYLIPGLWDMHVHLTVPGGREVLALYLANGVTGVRDMASEWSELTQWRREILAGTLIGPRIVSSGPYLEGGVNVVPHIPVRRPEEARGAIDSLARLGVDFVKVHGQLTRETYFAIARAARERGFVVAGHIPRAVTAEEASDSGQRSIEHMLRLPVPCTPAESIALQPRFSSQGALGTCTSRDLSPLYARLVRNNTWVVPTLAAQYAIAVWPSRSVPGDTVARYIPEVLRQFVDQIFPTPPDVPPGADSVGRALYAKRMREVVAMHRAGVALLTGTDAPLPNSPPGFGLHEELSVMVRAGLTPLEALTAATLAPARFLGAVDSLGTVEVGKVADLVMLDANPLADIANAKRVKAVMVSGRMYAVHRSEAPPWIRVVLD